jgi:hypothetical protein
MLGVVLALTVPASAMGIPFKVPYNGPFVMHLINLDMGTLYTGLEDDGVTPVTDGVEYTPGELESIRHSTLEDGEDAWGVFRIDTIYTGSNTGPNAISQGSVNLYSHADSAYEIVGIFYGRSDNTIEFDDGGTEQEIHSAGDTFEMFVQPKGWSEVGATTWDTALSGPSARIDTNEYPGIGYDGTGTDTIMLGAEQVLVGTTQAGFLDDEVVSVFEPSGGTGTGSFDIFLSWTGGTQLALFDTNGFPNEFAPPTPNGETADLRLKGTIVPLVLPLGDPWLVGTSDPAYGTMVPEPITMAGLMLGVGSVVGYVRRRRR